MKEESLRELNTDGFGPRVRDALLHPYLQTIRPHHRPIELSFGQVLSACRHFSMICAHSFERRCGVDELDSPDFASLRVEAAARRVQSVLNRWLFSPAHPVRPGEAALGNRLRTL